jgi:hypothetical protein
MGTEMAGFNIVHYKIKQGMDDEFLKAHAWMSPLPSGFKRGNLIKTGDHQYCLVGEWDSSQDAHNANPQMIGMLNRFREYLADQGPDIGVTNAFSGDSIKEINSE